MATVCIFSGGKLVRTFERVDDNSVTRQGRGDLILTFTFFDMGGWDAGEITDLGGGRHAFTSDKPKGPPPGLRRVTVSADWCVIYEPEAKP